MKRRKESKKKPHNFDKGRRNRRRRNNKKNPLIKKEGGESEKIPERINSRTSIIIYKGVDADRVLLKFPNIAKMNCLHIKSTDGCTACFLP